MNPTSYSDNNLQFGGQTVQLVTSVAEGGVQTRSTFILKAFTLTRGTNFVENADETGNTNAQHGHLTLPTGSATCQLPSAITPIPLTEFVAEETNGNLIGLVISEVGQTTPNDAERGITINIRKVLHSVVTSVLSAAGVVGDPFTYTITGTDSPTVFSAATLPTGLTVDTSTGIISGSPTTSGTTVVAIGATNTKGTGTASLSIVIAAE